MKCAYAKIRRSVKTLLAPAYPESKIRLSHWSCHHMFFIVYCICIFAIIAFINHRFRGFFPRTNIQNAYNSSTGGEGAPSKYVHEVKRCFSFECTNMAFNLSRGSVLSIDEKMLFFAITRCIAGISLPHKEWPESGLVVCAGFVRRNVLDLKHRMKVAKAWVRAIPRMERWMKNF